MKSITDLNGQIIEIPNKKVLGQLLDFAKYVKANPSPIGFEYIDNEIDAYWNDRLNKLLAVSFEEDKINYLKPFTSLIDLSISEIDGMNAFTSLSMQVQYFSLFN